MLQIQRERDVIEHELDSLAVQNERLVAAASDDTLCGHLRRAIHASRRSLASIAHDAEIEVDALMEFLEGTHGLPSETLDKIARAAGVVVTMVRA